MNKLNLKGNFTIVPNVIIRSKTLSNIEFRLVVVLLSLEPAYPSYTKIRAWTGLARSSIASSLRKLVKLGMVNYVPGNSHRRCNQYSFNPLESWKLERLAEKRAPAFRSISATHSGSKNGLSPVRKVNSNKIKVIKPNETTQDVSFSAISREEEGGCKIEGRSKAAARFQSQLGAELRGKQYFRTAPALIEKYIACHGSKFTSLADIEELVGARFRDRKGHEISEKLIPVLRDAYYSGEKEFLAAAERNETADARILRLKAERVREAQKLKEAGILLEAKKRKSLQRQALSRSLSNPLFEGVFRSGEEKKRELRRMHLGEEE